jgi:CheY-like chemotaxis protein
MQPIRILVVDDEDMMRELLTDMLEAGEREIETAPGGAEALSAIEARRPDLVLLDLNMPGVSGWDVIDRLGRQASPPPVVAISGMAVEPAALVTVQRHVFGFLPKPFTRDQLLKTCLRALEAARAAAGPTGPFPERRAHPRRNLLVPAALLSPDGTPAAQGQILNLSTGGAQLDLGAALKPGMEVALAFEIPGGRGPFRVTARVQWKQEGRLGLSFLDVSDDDRKRLGDLLQTS